MISFGFSRFAQGLRRSNGLLAAFGLAVVFVGWLRRQRAANERVTLYSTSLAPGQELHFTMTGPTRRRDR